MNDDDDDYNGKVEGETFIIGRATRDIMGNELVTPQLRMNTAGSEMLFDRDGFELIVKRARAIMGWNERSFLFLEEGFVVPLGAVNDAIEGAYDCVVVLKVEKHDSDDPKDWALVGAWLGNRKGEPISIEVLGPR